MSQYFHITPNVVGQHDNLEKGVIVFEFTPYSKYKIPRYRASKFIQPSFDLIPILSKLNGRQKFSYRLDGYHELQKLLEGKGLSNYLPDINNLFEKVKLVNSYKKFYLNIFSRINPKLGFFSCYYGIKGMAFNLACREFVYHLLIFSMASLGIYTVLMVNGFLSLVKVLNFCPLFSGAGAKLRLILLKSGTRKCAITINQYLVVI